MLFNIHGTISALAFLPFVLLGQILSRVILLTDLSLVLVASLWHQKVWFANLRAHWVEEPLELLVQLHIRKFHGGLETLQLYPWKLSSGSSARLAFRKRLQRSSHQISEDPQHVSSRESGVDYSIVSWKEYLST